LNENELQKKVNEMKTIITNFRTEINNNNYKGSGTVSKIPINTGIYTVGDENNEKIYKVNINNENGNPIIQSKKIKKGVQQQINQEGTFNNFGKLIQGIKTIKNKKFEGNFNNNGEFTNGKYFENNKLIYEGPFKDDQFDGEGKLYYENEKLEYEGFFENGKFHGEGTLYYEDGILEYEGLFENGKFHGEGKHYYEDGKLEYEGFFKDGKFNGEGKLYHEDGKIEYEGFFKDGKFNGQGKLYLGDYIYEGTFSENNIDGKKYDNNNKPLYEGIFSINFEGDKLKSCKFTEGNIYFKNGDDYISGSANENENENEKINGNGSYVSGNIQFNFNFTDNIPVKLRYLIVNQETDDDIFNKLNKLTKEQRGKLFKTLNEINVDPNSMKNTFEQLMIQRGVISKDCLPNNIVQNSRSKIKPSMILNPKNLAKSFLYGKINTNKTNIQINQNIDSSIDVLQELNNNNNNPN